MRNRRIIALIAVILSLIMAGCVKETAKPSPITITSGGHETTVQKKPERIVSLSPTATESLFAIGAGKQVVAVDEMSTYPADAPKTDLSGMTPNQEAILAKSPDLVVVMFDAANIVQALETAGVPVLVQPAAMTLSDAYQQITDLGTATHHHDAAKNTVAQIKSDITKATERVPADKQGRSYFWELDPTLYTPTTHTFVGDVLLQFKLRNIADGAPGVTGGYVQLTNEAIIAANPDFIFLSDATSARQSIETVSKRPGWGAIPAVKTQRVVAVDEDVASRWGPRIGQFAESIANALASS